MTEKQRRQKEKYMFDKERGICTRCHRERAMIGRVRCPECYEKVKQYAKEKYAFNKERGMCVRCRKEKAMIGSVHCQTCAAKKAKEDRETYVFYREHGICARCRKEKAMIGRVYCQKCAEEGADRKAERYAAMKENEKAEYTARNVLSFRKRRQARREAGICLDCGKRRVREGCVRCTECLIARRRKNRKSGIPRSARPEYGMCYICGEPVKTGFKVCQKHYDHMVKMATANIDSPAQQEARMYWKRLNKVVFRRRQSPHA